MHACISTYPSTSLNNVSFTPIHLWLEVLVRYVYGISNPFWLDKPTVTQTCCTHHQQAAPAAPAEDEEDSDALQRYKLVDARLRRLCEKKPSGKIKVPLAIHEQWLAGGKQRDELRALLEQFKFDKDPSVDLQKLFCWILRPVKIFNDIHGSMEMRWLYR